MKRRNFLQNSLCAGLGVAGASAMLGSLNSIAAATSPSAMQNDYKALVCIFLYGGNDGDNTLIPRSQTEYTAYGTARRNLAIPRDQLLPITPTTTDGRDWGFHPSLAWRCKTLFGSKEAGRLLPTLEFCLAPTTRDQFQRDSVPLPPQLFSHADQQAHWHTSWADQIPKTGWGGRLADIVNSAKSPTPRFQCLFRWQAAICLKSAARSSRT